MVVCLWLMISALMDYIGAEQDYEEMQEQVVSVSQQEELEEEIASQADAEMQQEIVTETGSGAGDDPDWWFKNVHIDFDALQKKNPDIIAWIRFDHQDQVCIDYPVMYTHSNDDYIHKDVDGNYRKSGTLFFEAVIENPVSDTHKQDFIYGHMMKNGSMFAPLKKYVKESSFYEANPYFTIYKRDGAYRYRIFSCFLTTAGSDTYQYGFTSADESYRAHIDTLVSRSVVKADRPDYEHNVVTLSTCAKSNSNQRIVVHAELIDSR